MVVVSMNKIDVGSFGVVYKLTFGNIEDSKTGNVFVTISELDAERLKPLFSHSKKTGKFKENEEWN